ncbi:MAG: amino acid permease [Promethearchaeota archaeon]|nr:MAG: amino acid permease [Candidatus Lokiarchaeota archaeon]
MSGNKTEQRKEEVGDEVEDKFEGKIGLFPLIVLGLSSLTGAGIYSLLGPAAEIAGQSMIMSLFIGIILAFFIAGLYSELIAVNPESGGSFVFVEKAFGRKALYMGWTTWLANMSYAALVSHTAAYFITSLFGIHTGYSILIAIGFTILMAGANILGSKFLSQIQIPLTFALIFSLVVGSIYLFLNPNPSFSWNINSFMPNTLIPTFIAAAIMFNIFIGFEDVCAISEETKEPVKNIPRAYLIMLIIATIMYSMVIFSLLISTSMEAIVGGEIPFLEAVESNQIIFIIVFFGSIFSLIATSGVALMTSSRNVLALSRKDFIDRRYSKIDPRTRTPIKAILLSTIVTILILISGQIEFYASISALTYMIDKIAMGVAIFRFRKTFDYPKKAFKIPGHPISTIIAIGTTFLLIISLGVDTLLVSIFWLLIGLILYLFFSSKRRVYGTIFLVSAFLFTLSNIILGLIILFIGFIYYLLTIADRHSIKFVLAGIKVFFIITVGIFVWAIKNIGILNAFDSNFILIFDKIILNLIIFFCIISLGTVLFDIIPLKEWVYYFIRKKDKKNVAIMVGPAQIIELEQKKLKTIHIINDFLSLIQIIASAYFGILATLIALDVFSIQIIISEMATELIFIIILIISSLTLLASGSFKLYITHESKRIGV